MANIYQVSPESLHIDTDQSERDIRTQMKRLEAEGQIEPIPVKPDMSLDRNHPDFWHYADAQVIAAIRLNWDTILVTY